MDNVIGKTAAGLRRMQNSPDFLLFCGADITWTWDEKEICGISVLYSCFIQNRMTDADVPFIPLWHNPKHGQDSMDRKRFNEGYEEYSDG